MRSSEMAYFQSHVGEIADKKFVYIILASKALNSEDFLVNSLTKRLWQLCSRLRLTIIMAINQD